MIIEWGSRPRAGWQISETFPFVTDAGRLSDSIVVGDGLPTRGITWHHPLWLDDPSVSICASLLMLPAVTRACACITGRGVFIVIHSAVWSETWLHILDGRADAR